MVSKAHRPWRMCESLEMMCKNCMAMHVSEGRNLFSKKWMNSRADCPLQDICLADPSAAFSCEFRLESQQLHAAEDSKLGAMGLP